MRSVQKGRDETAAGAAAAAAAAAATENCRKLIASARGGQSE
jgi:hypothetical protein